MVVNPVCFVLMFVTDDVVVAISNSGLVKVWTIHDVNDTRLVCTNLIILRCFRLFKELSYCHINLQNAFCFRSFYIFLTYIFFNVLLIQVNESLLLSLGWEMSAILLDVYLSL